MKELEIPPAALDDPKAREMLRLWAAKGKQHVTVRLGCYHDQGRDECAAWGIVVADFIKHVANGMSQTYDLDYDKSIVDIMNMALTELKWPTSDVQGE